MKQMIDRILACYGSDTIIEKADGAKTVRAFVQPVTGKGWDSMRRTVRALGEIPMGKYVYIGPADTPVGDEDRVVCGEIRYRVCRMETLMLEGTALYNWGLLQKDGGDDPWNS